MQVVGYRMGEELAHDERTVLRCAVRESDSLPVLLKYASREYPRSSELARLRFEYHLLCRLAADPRARCAILPALGLETSERGAVLVLERCPRTGFHHLPRPLPLSLFFPLSKGLVKALSALHAVGVVHKNLQPSSVWFDDASGETRLLGFQLATELSRERPESQQPGTLEGTLAYLSPEQTGRMNRALDYRSDYYSLGVLLYEVLAGRLPLEASDPMGWVHAHISRTPEPVGNFRSDVPGLLGRWLDKLMAKDPAERYQSARGMLADLTLCEREHAGSLDGRAVVLGADDVSDRLSLPHSIVGRRAETERLLAAFEVARRGAARVVFIEGYSGIGKSSLVREVHRPIAERRGYFASGKYDQLDQGVPYAALIQALRSVIRQLLGEPEASLVQWRERLSVALRGTEGVLADLVPELSLLLGPLPPAPDLDPLAAQHRFRTTLTRLIQGVASPSHPLALFLDDMQWADVSTLQWLVGFVESQEVQHFLLLGAFRENEVGPGHPLAHAMDEIDRRAPGTLERLRLEPLKAADVDELVALALRCSPHHVESLSREIQRKSQGNPFIAIELLTTLHRAGNLSLDLRSGRWSWDLEAIRALPVSDDAAALMLLRLGQLPPSTREALRLAACIGAEFSLQAVATLAGCPLTDAARWLWPALEQDLVVPLGIGYRLDELSSTHDEATAEVRYRFAHDRVQRGAYLLSSEEERARTHLRIGRHLLATNPKCSETSEVFAVVSQLSRARALLVREEERAELARLYQRASALAFARTAFVAALEYIDGALACLSQEEWRAHGAWHFELRSQRVSSELMCGNFARALSLCDELVQQAPTRAASAGVCLLRCQVSMAAGQPTAALDAARAGLTLLDIDYPSELSAIEAGIGQGIGRMQEHLARVEIEALPALPATEQVEHTIAMQLLFEAVPPSTVTCPPLFILTELIMFDLELRVGVTAASAKNFVDCGLLQGGLLADYERAYRLGKAAFVLMDRLGARGLACGIHFVFAAYISGWTKPYAEALASFNEARHLGFDTGDHLHLAFSEVLRVRMLLFVGTPLEECAAEARALLETLRRVHATLTLDGHQMLELLIARLRADPKEQPALAVSATRFSQTLAERGNAQYGFQHAQGMLLFECLQGDWEAAAHWRGVASAHERAAATLFTVAEFCLCECLVIAHHDWPRADAEQRPGLLTELESRVRRLEGWAARCPDNFAHKAQLGRAELARLRGEPAASVAVLYRGAINLTSERFVHLRALGALLYSMHSLAAGDHTARGLLVWAMQVYADWGAHGVAALVRERFGGAVGVAASAPSSRVSRAAAAEASVVAPLSLDLSTVLKVNRLISREVRAERLFARLMAALVENAGAQHGCLVLPEVTDAAVGPPVEATRGAENWADSALLVRARHGRAPADAATRVGGLEEEDGVCAAIVRYVARSLDTLVIDDASADTMFGRDPTIVGRRVKSVLCMPVVNQARLVAVLYLENNATTHAFPPDRVETLSLIAGQAAISISNALLYEQLEQKVEARTRELTARTRQVEAMLDSMQQGIFTLNDNLEIQPEYSKHLPQILECPDPTGMTLRAALFEGSDLSAQVIELTEGALRFAFGGGLAVARANADHLVRTYRRLRADGTEQYLEVDWSFIAGEDSVVAAVLGVLRDVTAVRRLELVAKKAEGEAVMISEVLNGGVPEVHGFFQRIDACLLALERRAASDPSHDEQMAAFRELHSLKAQARVLGLKRMVDALHGAEDTHWSAGDMTTASAVARDESRKALRRVLIEYRQVAEAKLGRLWQLQDEGLRRALTAIEQALAGDTARPSYPARVLGEVRLAVERARAVSLDDIVRESATVVPSLATELGKAAPTVRCEAGGELLLERAAQELLRDVLAHCLRNSVDHGLEAEAERTRAGKRGAGSIVVTARRAEGALEIHLTDDGRGLAVGALRRHPGRAAASDEELAEDIFRFGVSSASRVTQVSGRGVGLDAVRSSLREHGGDVSLQFTAPAADGYRPFELVLRLPSHLLVS